MEPQSAKKRKRDNSDVNPRQNQGALSDNQEGENGEMNLRKLETHPLNIDSVLEKTFPFLDPASIKKARQVNKKWSVEGAKMLFAKCFIQTPQDIQHKQPSVVLKKLDAFRAFLSLKSDDVSMIPHVAINAVDDVELWKYLGVLGQQVKSVKLIYKMLTDQQLLNSTLDRIPNVAYFGFPGYSSVVYSDESNVNMMVLTFVMSKAAKARNPLVISHITLQAQDVKTLEVTEKFADCSNFTIQNLQIAINSSIFTPQLKPRILTVLYKVLSANQNVLKELILWYCQMYLPRLDFPVMAALTHLTLEFRPRTSGYMQQCKFSPSFRFSEKIPNLESVDLEYAGAEQGLSNDFFGNVFQNAGLATSVKSLKYSDSDLRLNIDPLLETFPNIEQFENKQTGCSEPMFRSLWQLGRNLKRMNITIVVRGSDHRIGDFDSILTGFAPETVEMMRKSRKKALLENFGRLRVSPSILNLTELERITINLKGVDFKKDPFIPKRMLVVAAKYGFQLLPKQPKIFIHVEYKHRGMNEDTSHEGAKKALNELSKLPNTTVTCKEFISWYAY